MIKIILLSFSLLLTASSLTFPSFNGYQAFELSSNSTESFNLEAQTWIVSRALTPNITTICSNTILLGGYGVLAYEGYFEKTYSSLPSHNSIYYQIQVLVIDNWSSSDSLILQFDGVNKTFSWSVPQIVARTPTAKDICGQPGAKELQYLTLMGGVAHTSDTLKFRIISKVNQSPLQASFGVRNISITVSERDPTAMCYRSGDNIATGAAGECPCKIHYYPKDLSPLECEACDPSCLDCFDNNPDECTQCLPGYSYTSSKKCIKCASSCATCTGSSSNQCTTCAPGYWLQADGTCTTSCSLPSGYSQQVGDFKVCQTGCNAGQFMFADGTCGSSCPYMSQNVNGNLICKLCANNSDYYYQWNGTCGATCPAPLVANGQLCRLPCASGDFYFPSNGTCGTTCGGSFVSSMVFDVVKQCASPCDIGEFLLWDGTCSSSCPPPYFAQTVNNILVCKLCFNDNDFYYQWNETCGATCPAPLMKNGQLCQLPCASGDIYFPSNNTCDSVCNSPFVVTSFGGDVQQCESPCGASEYLLWNGTCASGCPAPYYQRVFGSGLIFCDACEPGYLMFPNETCLSQCDAPLQQETINGSSFCSFPCSGAKPYLLQNGTCTGNCAFPKKVITGSLGEFCEFPCQGNDFFYVKNSSCLAGCSSPWKSESINGIKICLPPCGLGEFLDEVSSSCLSECNSPFLIETKDTIPTCINPLHVSPPKVNPTTETSSSTSTSNSSGLTENFIKSANDVTDTTGKLTSVGTFITSVLSSSTPSGITLTVLVKMLKYIRYLEINYPPLLELMLKDQAKSPISLDIGFGIPQGLQKKFERKPLPEKFEKYHVPSNFIVNCWQELSMMGLVILVLLLATLIAHLTKKHKQLSSLFKRVSKATRWNFFLLIVCSNLVEIGLFSCLQMRSTSFDSFGEGFGLVLSVLMSSFSLFVLIQAFYIPRQLGKNSKRKWENWSILFKEFKSHNFFQQSYMFFFLFRILIFDILIGCFYNYPVLQAALLSTISIAMVSYISICRPFKEKFFLVKSLVEESIVASVNICVLILALMDKARSENQTTRVALGDVVILINFAFNIIALIFALVEISIRGYGIYKLAKTEKSRGLKFWKKVILVLIEPESLGAQEKANAKKKIGSTKKVHPHVNPGSLVLLNSNNQTPKKLSHNSSISDNLDFTGSLSDNATSRNALGGRYNSRNLLFHSLTPSNNSDDAEAGNGELKESTPTNEEANLKFVFRSSSLSRLHLRRTLINRSRTNLDENVIVK